MTDIIDYNSDLEYLLKIHAEECESFSILHRYSFEKYSERSNYINIPVIILSSAIGFATGIDIGYDKMNIILGVSSIFVGIIKSIDTYFQLGKRSESHRICSLQFQQINKKIMIELSLKRDQRISAKDMLQIIKTDIKNLQDIAPLIDEEIIEMFKKNYGIMDPSSNKIKFSAHTPNLCNGLSQVTINGEISLNGDSEGRGGRNRRRRRSSSRGSHGSHGSRGSRGSRDNFSDDSDDNNGGGNGGGSYSRSNKRNDGNTSAGTSSSGFINSVSNLFHKGVNLIKGSTPPPSEPELNNKGNRHSSRNNSRNSSHNQNSKNKNSVIELTNVVVDGVVNNEVREIISNNLNASNTNTSVKSTPLITSGNGGYNNLILTEAHMQQLQMLQTLQEKHQLQQQLQPPQQPPQLQPPQLQPPQLQPPQLQPPQLQPPQLQPPQLQDYIHLSSRPPSSTSHRSHHSFNPVNFTNTITVPTLVASAEFVYNNNTTTSLNTSHTPGNMSQRISRPHSVAGSTHNSVVGSNTPRNLGDLDTTAPNQVIEIHEIQPAAPEAPAAPPAPALATENLQINLNNIPLENDDNSSLM